MPKHQEEPTGPITFEENFTQVDLNKDANFSGNALPASILIGAVLISASLFYNTNKLIKNGIGGAVAPTNQVVAQNPDPNTAGNLQAGAVVTVNPRSDAPAEGSSRAKVTMYEFSDFQCPFCKKYFETVYGQIKSKYIDTGKVRFIYRHFPLSFHQNAQKAAEAGECANRQGKFWEYHNILFTKGQSDGTGLDVASLKQYAKDVGLNTSQFNSCLDSGATASVVAKDIADGTAAGVSGTPTLFVNGKRIVGAQPLATFEQAIEEALK